MSLDVASIGYDPTPTRSSTAALLYGGFPRPRRPGVSHGHIFADMDNMVWDLGDPFGPTWQPRIR